MANDSLLVQQLRDLISRYRRGAANLNSLSFKSELLVEEMRACLSPSGHSEAMNCVYVIEEINAVVLDENRSVSQEELAEIERRLALLEKLVSLPMSTKKPPATPASR